VGSEDLPGAGPRLQGGAARPRLALSGCEERQELSADSASRRRAITRPRGLRARAGVLDASRLGHTALATITALAAVLRGYHLGYQSMWQDEGYTAAQAQRPFGQMLHLFKFEANGSLYTLISWPLAHLDLSLVLLRVPSAVAGVAAVAATYWAGRELSSRRVGLIGAFLLAVNPAAVFYSQTARAYMFVALFTALSYGSLALAVRTRSRQWWILYAVVLTAAGYSNVLSLLFVPAAQAFVVLPAGRRAIKQWLGAGGVVAIASVPLAYLLHAESSRRSPLYYLSAPRLAAIREWLRDVAAGHASGQTAAAYGILVLATGLIVAAMWRRRRALMQPWGAPGAAPIVAWAVVPPALAFAVSQVRPVFSPPYLIAALPGLCLLVALCLEGLAPRVRITALVVFSLLFALCLAWQASHPTEENWREAAHWVQTRRQPADPVLIDTISALSAIGYYDHALRAPSGWLAVKEWHDTQMPAGVSGLTDPGGYGDAPPGPPTPALIANLTHHTGRAFVLLTHAGLQGDLLNDNGIGWARRNCRTKHLAVRSADAFEFSSCPHAP